MHWQYWPLNVGVPKNTPASAPVTRGWPITQGHLKKIEILVPAGHHGNTGLRIVYHGVQIYPWSIATSWLNDSGNLRTVEWEDEIMATGLQVQAYNTDLVGHTFYLLAQILPTVSPAAAIAETGTATATTIATRRRIVNLRRKRVEVTGHDQPAGGT